MINFLRCENERFLKIRETSSSLLTDSNGSVIFNSKLPDDLSNINIVGSNSVNNYLKGKISYVNIHQSKASTIADEKGSSTISFMLPLDNDTKTYSALYVSKYVGSSYTAGAEETNSNLGCDQTRRCKIFGKCSCCCHKSDACYNSDCRGEQ